MQEEGGCRHLGSVDKNHKILQLKGTTLQLLYNNLRNVESGDSGGVSIISLEAIHIKFLWFNLEKIKND